MQEVDEAAYPSQQKHEKLTTGKTLSRGVRSFRLQCQLLLSGQPWGFSDSQSNSFVKKHCAADDPALGVRGGSDTMSDILRFF